MTTIPTPRVRSCKPSVRPVYVRGHSDALGVDVARRVAWRGACSCGWRSRTYRERADAATQAREHADERAAR